MMMVMWCEAEADNDSHGFESRDGGQTWRQTGELADDTLGPPMTIDIAAGCPVCGSQLTVGS